MDVGMSKLELTDAHARVGCEGTQTQKQDQAGDDADRRHGLRQRQDSQRNGLGHHDHPGLPPGHALVLDSVFSSSRHGVSIIALNGLDGLMVLLVVRTTHRVDSRA